jgi:hypothetical protein
VKAEGDELRGLGDTNHAKDTTLLAELVIIKRVGGCARVHLWAGLRIHLTSN